MALAATHANAQSPAASLTVAQVADLSPAQQDVSRDFLAGARVAWQNFNAQGGLHGRPVRHWVLETDGTSASLQAAWQAAHADSNCIALSGCVGDSTASRLLALAQTHKAAPALAQAAPWLQNSTNDVGDTTFPIFAGRQSQIAHAVRALAVMGVQDLGVVYAHDIERASTEAEMTQAATSLGLRLRAFQPTVNTTLAQLGRTLDKGAPIIMMFVGGTPELLEFVGGLQAQQRRRYVVALADVNLQVLAQSGVTIHSSVSVIATQVVPMLNSAIPVVRAYRENLAKLFDEPPSPIGLAGFIAARYTAQVLASMDAAFTRQNVLAAFQRRSSMDMDGFIVNFKNGLRSAASVTLGMLASDGRIVG
ncbi:MAG TPA: ABC transporter substrate-binding protein [Burkholderiaceae bacterium]